MRHQSPYICGIIIITVCARSRGCPVGKALHQAGQLHQVDSTQKCPSMTHDDLWIRAHKIGPLRRNRPYGSAVTLQQEAFAIPVVSFADAGKLSPEQWVERMRDPHKLQRCISKSLHSQLRYKRLERGRFIWPSAAGEAVTISPAQLSYLLSGIDWRNPQETLRPTRVG